MNIIKLLKDILKLIRGTHFLTAYGKKRGRKPKQYGVAPSQKVLADIAKLDEAAAAIALRDSPLEMQGLAGRMQPQPTKTDEEIADAFVQPVIDKVMDIDAEKHALSDTIGGDGYAGPGENPSECPHRDTIGDQSGGDHDNR